MQHNRSTLPSTLFKAKHNCNYKTEVRDIWRNRCIKVMSASNKNVKFAIKTEQMKFPNFSTQSEQVSQAEVGTQTLQAGQPKIWTQTD